MDSVLVSELTSDPLSTTLRPRPLSVAATRHFEERILGTDPADEFCAACLEASGGNPLLLSELLNALAEEGVAPGADQTARVREIGPAAVSRSVEQRLAHLPAEAQAFAQALAVLGDGAEVELIAALARIDQEAAANAAEMLARVDVIERRPAPAFVHALVRDAVYLEMLPGQRQEAHSRAAALLTERGAPARRAAAHLLLTPRAGSERVVATLREAAREALARSAPANRRRLPQPGARRASDARGARRPSLRTRLRRGAHARPRRGDPSARRTGRDHGPPDSGRDRARAGAAALLEKRDDRGGRAPRAGDRGPDGAAQ